MYILRYGRGIAKLGWHLGSSHARRVDIVQLAHRRADYRRSPSRPAGDRVSQQDRDDQMGCPPSGSRPRAAHRAGYLPPDYRLAGRILRRLAPGHALSRVSEAVVRFVTRPDRGLQGAPADSPGRDALLSRRRPGHSSPSASDRVAARGQPHGDSYPVPPRSGKGRDAGWLWRGPLEETLAPGPRASDGRGGAAIIGCNFPHVRPRLPNAHTKPPS